MIIERWSELWLCIDRHYPGDRSEERARAIDDLYEAVTEDFIDLNHDCRDWL